MKKRFSKKTIEQLGYYVYAYINKSSEEILYVGKGKDNRAFHHVKKYKEKNIDIRIDILRHGLNDNQAKKIESTLIDSLSLDKLDNKVRGGKSKFFGRISVEDIEKTFGSIDIHLEEFKHNGIFFFAHNSLGEGNDFYDSCRQFWNVSIDRVSEKNNGELKYEYAFLLKGNFIEEVYRIINWFPAGSTHSTRKYYSKKNIKGNDIKRFEFIGQIADSKIQTIYKHKSVIEKGKPMLATQKGFKYIK